MSARRCQLAHRLTELKIEVHVAAGLFVAWHDLQPGFSVAAGLFIAWLMEGGPGKGRGTPSKVWACEPLPQNLALLRSNLQTHELTDKVQDSLHICMRSMPTQQLL